MATPTGNPNPNPNPPFELGKLFRPPNPMPTATAAPIFPGAAGGPAGPPPPSGPYSYPPVTPPFHRGPYLHYPQDPHSMPRPVVSFPMPNPNLNPNPNANPNAAVPGPNAGVRLMQLLGNSGPTQLETAVSMPPPTSEFAQPTPLPAMPSAPPARMLSSTSSKVPRGRLLVGGERAVHDVDSRLPGEAQPPQLEVTPITKYTSDPGLVLGRQIAVNRTYIVYGLKLGNIRVLNINTALRSLLRGHSQRVTDMAFFAEDVHRLASASVDGRIYVWRIDEGPDAENKPQITGKIEIAIQIVGDVEAYHPRICWHSHKQEILFVGIGNCVLRIDTTKVGRGRNFAVEEPVKCHLEKLIDGVRLVGKHEGDVMDLSISQWMSTRLASGSKDGTVKIWDDRKPVPLSILKPHDGQAVYSVAFLTAPERPNHINLITAGPLNREIKIWASTNEDGWLLPSDSESWNCTQTLELVSSLEPRVEEAFFNQVAVLPQASLILLANAKKNAIYAVHVEYGPDPASTRLDYIADFTVAMPILSLTGTHESQPDGEQVVQVYCVQTMAIQQYGLDLSLCSPPTADTTGFGRDPAISRVYKAPAEVAVTESSTKTSFTDSYSVNASSRQPAVDQSADFDPKPSAPPLAYSEGDGSAHVPSAPLASKMELPGSGPAPGTRDIDQSAFDYTTNRNMERDALKRQDTPMPMRKDILGKDELRDGHSDVAMLPNPRLMFQVGGNATHLVTPSEIISGTLSSAENNDVSKSDGGKVQDISCSRIAEVEPKHIDESKPDQNSGLEAVKETQIVCENMGKPHSVEQTVEMISERSVTTDKYSVEESQSSSDKPTPDHTGVADENALKKSVEMPEKSDYSVSSEQSSSYTKEEKVLHPQTSGQPSPPVSAFNSTDSHEPLSSAYPPTSSFPEVAATQGMLQQLIGMQKDMEKQLGTVIPASVAKESKKLETSIGRSMEKSMKAHMDAFWARLQEENTKREKADRERMQQLVTLITSSINKDIPSNLEKSLKKPAMAMSMSMAMSKAFTARDATHFQHRLVASSSQAAPRLPLLPRRPGLAVTVASPRRLLPASPRSSSTESDLSPTPQSERTMTAWDLASLWVGLVVGVPSYYLAGSLVDLGMSALQGVATVTFANLIVLVTLVLTAAPAVTHGLPFPVLARAAFGIRGAHVPAVIRALVGCGWFGIESWIGGRAIFLLLPSRLKSYPPLLAPVPGLGAAPLEFACFLAFWAAQLGVIMNGMEAIRKLEKFSAPVLFVLTSALLAWAYTSAGGFGRILSLPPRLTGAEFWKVFFPSLTANISFWATVAINIPDFARYARSQADQVLGQAGLPVFMGMFTFAGLAITSATEAIFGRVVSDPIELLGRIGGPATTFLAIFGIGLATVTTNIAANVVAPANALVSMSPRRFTFAKGALVTALLGIAFQPWRLLSSSESFVYTWLLGYSALMGPIGGVILADHYIVRRAALDVDALYSEDRGSPYYFQGGFNVAAMAAMAAGVAPIVPGFLQKVGVLPSVSKAFVTAYNNAWFVSFFVAGAVYCLLCCRRDVPQVKQHGN